MKLVPHIVQTSIAAIGIIVCVFTATLLPQPWEGTGGRDFRPKASVAALLILLTSTILYGRLRWRLINLLAALLVIEVLTLFIISYFSGLTGFEIFDSFNLNWLLYMNIFTGAPWLLGLLFGKIWRSLKTKN